MPDVDSPGVDSKESEQFEKRAKEWIPAEREPRIGTAVKGAISKKLYAGGSNQMFYVRALRGHLVSVLRLDRFDYSEPHVGDAVVAYLDGGENKLMWRACKRPTDESPQQST